MRRHVYGDLNKKEKDLLKLADFIENKRYSWIFDPGISTVIGILRDYWHRWFGGRAERYAKYIQSVYWIPWVHFTDDVFKIKNYLTANLFNKNCRASLYEQLCRKNIFDDQLRNFDSTSEQPLMWKEVSHQEKGA